jgi:hypothetical protein
VVPEFNPFKYNSFPVNAARQAYLLTAAVQRTIARLARNGRMNQLAPVLAFQSAMDFTVSTRAVIGSLYQFLPANGSELVLFDLNRNTRLGLLLRTTLAQPIDRIVPPPPRNWRLTIITNTPSDPMVNAHTYGTGASAEYVHPLNISYPREVFSLSHVAMPFPSTDGLYGSSPDPQEDYGVNLGAVAARGEVGVLIVNLGMLSRITWNPFFPYMLSRIDEGIVPLARR